MNLLYILWVFLFRIFAVNWCYLIHGLPCGQLLSLVNFQHYQFKVVILNHILLITNSFLLVVCFVQCCWRWECADCTCSCVVRHFVGKYTYFSLALVMCFHLFATRGQLKLLELDAVCSEFPSRNPQFTCHHSSCCWGKRILEGKLFHCSDTYMCYS